MLRDHEIARYINIVTVEYATTVGREKSDSMMMKIALALLSVILAVNGKNIDTDSFMLYSHFI